MSGGRRRRILVALEPRVLEGVFAALLAGHHDVVQYHDATDDELVTATYDAAVVTIPLPDGLRCETVISLPTDGGSGPWRLTAAGRSREVEFSSSDDLASRLIDLLAGGR